MTQNRPLKRRVRERMARTGERYTAARRHIVTAPAGANDPDTTARDEPLHGPTGRRLGEWFAMLDAWGAAERNHPDIARWLVSQGVPGWWAQDVTVRYEKHIGRRVLGQRGATFSATATRTLAASSDEARAAFTDAAVRARWLSDIELTQRPNRAKAVARFDVGDGDGRLVVGFDAKGDSRVTVSIEHEKLADADSARRWTSFWRDRLTHLRAMLER